MQPNEVKEQVMAALALLREGRRDEAAASIGNAITNGPASGDQWKSIARLAGQIGEIDLAIAAMRKYAETPPVKLSRLLDYWKELAGFGRPDMIEKEIARLKDQVGDHPAVLHVQGQLAAQAGQFDRAAELYLKVVEHPDFAAQGWFSLSAISDISAHPTWIDRMLAVDKAGLSGDTSGQSRLLYGLGKAFSDCGDYARAMEFYARGAEARRGEAHYNPDQLERFALALIRDFTPRSLAELSPPGERPRASIFVNGLPRSGTTLVEQILVAHSDVHDGAEVNLARAALTTTVDYSYSGAAAYDRRERDGDPWGKVAGSYDRMLEMRFRSGALVVDKSLSQSHMMGLIRHAMPACPVIWMRRDPADVAISCYRTFFTSPFAWCWRFEDMGHYFAVEDALFDHWMGLFGDDILSVDYQELVREPAANIRKIAKFAGLSWEDGMERSHEKERSVRTASLQQVRQPISTKAIGKAEAYAPWMGDFWRSYESASKRIAAERS